MRVHANAKLGPAGRLALVELVGEGVSLRAAHRAGLLVHVWTVNERSTMHELLDLGVDGIMTDRPRVLRDVFAERGLPM